MTIAEPAAPSREMSPRYFGWRVVAVCFVTAIFSWCFGFYGQGVFLAELRHLMGWQTSVISMASTIYYLFSAVLVVFVSDAIAYFGPRRFVLFGIACFGIATATLGWVDAIWQLFAVYLLMSFGWAAMGLATISTLIGDWFHERRGLALSLALNGASFAGVLGAPLLLFASDRFGFRAASAAAAALMAAILVPMTLAWIKPRPPQPERRASAEPSAPAASAAVSSWTRGRALRSLPFWTVTAPFALGLLAQVGFLVHQIALLTPRIGHPLAGIAVSITAISAVAGRVGLGVVIDRLDQRLVSAGCFVSQAAALIVIAGSGDPATLLICSVIFGLSVGNLITLPALIIQREFEPPAFAMLMAFSTAICQFTYAFGPGLVGLLRDFSGGYYSPIFVCAAFDIIAAGIVVIRRSPLRRAVGERSAPAG
jgi:MFS family permease